MVHNQFLLLKSKCFLPLFLVQFLGAYHDNLFKNALVVMILYGLGAAQPENPAMLVTLAAGVFILPFVLFSAIGGELADKFAKERVIRAVKLAEVIIALLGTAALLSSSIVLCFIVLFLLGAQSAFFGPSKYSILPQHLDREELIGGNALINTGTFLAILIGTISGTVLITFSIGEILVSALLILCAVSGYLASRTIPAAPPKATGLKLDLNPVTETVRILRQSFVQGPIIRDCIIGVAWFYFLGGMFLAQLPNFTKQVLHVDEQVLAFFMALFSIGIAIGGLLNNRLLKGEIKASLSPWAGLLISAFSIDLYFASGHVHAHGGTLMGLETFLSEPAHWRVITDLALIAMSGGLFVVPLNAMIQHSVNEDIRARILAGSGIMNALFIIGSSVFSALLIARGFSIDEMFVAFAVLNLGMAGYMYRLHDKKAI